MSYIQIPLRYFVSRILLESLAILFCIYVGYIAFIWWKVKARPLSLGNLGSKDYESTLTAPKNFGKNHESMINVDHYNNIIFEELLYTSSLMLQRRPKFIIKNW